MPKRMISAILLFIMVLSCNGCSGPWRKKFVRKKTEVKEEPLLQPKDYRKEFTNRQFYANHFAFWGGAEAELLSCLKNKKNQKRIKTYASYSQEELKKLYQLLVEEKQKQLLPFIKELEEIAAKASRPNYLDFHRNSLIKRLEEHYRTVSRRFSYYSMREYIRPEEGQGQEDPERAGVSEEQPEAETPKAEGPEQPEDAEESGQPESKPR